LNGRRGGSRRQRKRKALDMAHKLCNSNEHSPKSHLLHKLEEMERARKHGRLTIDFDEGGIRNWEVAVRGHRSDKAFRTK